MPLRKPSDQGALNAALARALGVQDLTRVRSVVLRIEAGRAPKLLVESWVDSGLTTRLQNMRLRAELPSDAAADFTIEGTAGKAT